MKWERREDGALFNVIIGSIYCSIVDLGLSFGDGRSGRWSLWMIPIASGLTLILQMMTIIIGDRTERNRRGTRNPSFFHSITLYVLSALLASFWLVAAIFTLIRLAKYENARQVARQPGAKPVAWVEAAFAMINSSLLWMQCGLVVHYRRKFYSRVQEALQVFHIPHPDDDPATVYDNYDAWHLGPVAPQLPPLQFPSQPPPIHDVLESYGYTGNPIYPTPAPAPPPMTYPPLPANPIYSSPPTA